MHERVGPELPARGESDKHEDHERQPVQVTKYGVNGRPAPVVRNDTLAVRLYPSTLLVADGPDQLAREGRENHWDFNPDYAEAINGTAPAAPHLYDPPKLIVPDERWWDLLAISAALRDRHFPTAIRAAATAWTGQLGDSHR